MSIHYESLSETTGVLVTGCDVSRVSDKEFAELHQLWLDKCVLVFRGQDLTDEQLVAFGSRFGELEVVGFYDAKPFYPEVLDELQVVANVGHGGEPISGGLANYEADWHSDLSYQEKTPGAAGLYAREVSSVGGDTWFLSTYAALDALPHSLRAAAEGMLIEHKSGTNTAGKPRAAAAGNNLRAAHPAVRLHPESGRNMLYLGRRSCRLAAGDEECLPALWDHVDALAHDDRYRYRHRWNRGDLIIWDNRSTLHRRDSFSQEERRVLHRFSVT